MTARKCPICERGPKIIVGGRQDKLEHWCSEVRGHYTEAGSQTTMIERWNKHCETIEAKEGGDNMREIHKEKSRFVSGKLKPVLLATDPNILSVEYTTRELAGQVYAEEVHVTRKTRSGPVETVVSVTGDNEKAILLDVTRAMAKEWRI